MTETTPEPLTPDQKLDLLLASRLICVECLNQHATAARRGTPDDQLPQLHIATMIVDGKSACPNHVQFNSPLLIAPGQGMPAQQ